MSDFCRQCSIHIFGQDGRDLAGITTASEWREGRARTVLCEGCGPIQVDPDGRCVSADCDKQHGANPEAR